MTSSENSMKASVARAGRKPSCRRRGERSKEGPGHGGPCRPLWGGYLPLKRKTETTMPKPWTGDNSSPDQNGSSGDGLRCSYMNLFVRLLTNISWVSPTYQVLYPAPELGLNPLHQGSGLPWPVTQTIETESCHFPSTLMNAFRSSWPPGSWLWPKPHCPLLDVDVVTWTHSTPPAATCFTVRVTVHKRWRWQLPQHIWRIAPNWHRGPRSLCMKRSTEDERQTSSENATTWHLDFIL